ncbi:MAG: sodium:proton antiporter [Lentisphaeraceae bacterium]|nr:sodium:proton antiporter [Lentisphaeraceae bacterium]
MTVIEIAAVLITASAALSFINAKYIKMPTAIGLMVLTLVASMALIAIGHFNSSFAQHIHHFVEGLNFEKTVMDGMLSILLFAGALHVNLNDLKGQRFVVGIMATAGVLISTFVIGGLAYLVFNKGAGVDISLPFCLLFGALISPTDPIAVLSILKTAGCPKTLETKIAGESLFNDGFGVVVFMVLLAIAVPGHEEASAGLVFKLLAEEAVGGIVFGMIIGWLAYQMLKSIENYQVEILVTLALVLGGYALAMRLHTSGPIAIVVAGLCIGNYGRSFAMSKKTIEHLDTFWELIDEILNAILFVMIGLELIVLSLKGSFLGAGLILIPVVLFGRFIAISGTITVLKRFREFSPGVIKILTWSGIRGGISIALALAIPKVTASGESLADERNLLLTATYVIVAFSIIVQGLTVKKLVVACTGKN